MLPRDLIGAVTRVTPGQAAEQAVDPRQQAFARAVAPLLGKAIHGEIQAKLTDGTFIVKFADTQARMQLPPGALVGADVPLTLIGLHPRPTFQVGAQTTATGFAEAGPAPQAETDAPGAPLGYREGAALGRAGALLASSAGLGAQAAEPVDVAGLVDGLLVGDVRPSIDVLVLGLPGAEGGRDGLDGGALDLVTGPVQGDALDLAGVEEAGAGARGAGAPLGAGDVAHDMCLSVGVRLVAEVGDVCEGPAGAVGGDVASSAGVL